MQHIKDITPKQLMEGITGHYAHGQNMSFGYVEIKERHPDAKAPACA